MYPIERYRRGWGESKFLLNQSGHSTYIFCPRFCPRSSILDFERHGWCFHAWTCSHSHSLQLGRGGIASPLLQQCWALFRTIRGKNSKLGWVQAYQATEMKRQEGLTLTIGVMRVLWKPIGRFDWSTAELISYMLQLLDWRQQGPLASFTPCCLGSQFSVLPTASSSHLPTQQCRRCCLKCVWGTLLGKSGQYTSMSIKSITVPTHDKIPREVSQYTHW